jgi:long-subunit acyl-CoA synthetase (AMP-forming)
MIDIGLQKGDILSIYSQNRPEWVIADYATFSCGASRINLSHNSAPKRLYPR